MTPTNSCLDGETLAAWVDGGLSRNDAAMAEAHVSSCPRCQEIAGLIVKTTPVTVVDAPWWRRRAAWLVPVTAGVAAAGLLMIAPTNPAPSPAPAPAAATLESARNAATPAAPPAAPPVAPARGAQQPAETKPAETKKERQREERANTAVAAAPAPRRPPAAGHASAARGRPTRRGSRTARRRTARAADIREDRRQASRLTGRRAPLANHRSRRPRAIDRRRHDVAGRECRGNRDVHDHPGARTAHGPGHDHRRPPVPHNRRRGYLATRSK